MAAIEINSNEIQYWQGNSLSEPASFTKIYSREPPYPQKWGIYLLSLDFYLNLYLNPRPKLIKHK
jgi:hypothetical protein